MERPRMARFYSGPGPNELRFRIFAVFIFLYFLFSFFTKIYFRFGNLQEYTPGAPLPGGRDLAASLRSDSGFCAKTFAKIFARRSLGAGRPAAGRPAPKPPDSGAASPGRPTIGRPALPPLYKGWQVPHPSFASLKFQKPRKKREGGRERGEALPDFRAGDCR